VSRSFDIPRLGRFITAAEQKQQHLPTLYEINAIAGSKMNPHLADTSSNRRNVAKISKLSGVETSKNSGASFSVFQTTQPIIEHVGGLQLVNVISVSDRIHLHQLADTSKLAERVRLTRAIDGPRPSSSLGARCARPIRLSCRIIELGEFVHRPCPHQLNKKGSARLPFLFHLAGE